MKTVGGDTFHSYYSLYYIIISKISKIRHKFKIDSIVKNSMSLHAHIL